VEVVSAQNAFSFTWPFVYAVIRQFSALVNNNLWTEKNHAHRI